MPTVLDHKMWMKQILKGFAERVPESVYQKLAYTLFDSLPGEMQAKISLIENLNQAYMFGHDLAAMIFGGDDERS